jgi:hypothetical protein
MKLVLRIIKRVHTDTQPRSLSPLATMAPKTTWEEMARLGWLKQQVFEKLNAQRGGTMTGGARNDMALNTDFAEDWRWVATYYMIFPVANVDQLVLL